MYYELHTGWPSDPHSVTPYVILHIYNSAICGRLGVNEQQDWTAECALYV